MTNPRRSARLTWTGRGEAYRGRGGDTPEIVLDGSSGEGPSPMETLLLGLAGCMAIDVQSILQKGRVPVEAIDVEMDGERAPDPPRRFTAITMEIRVRGPAPDDQAKLDRAVELSRDKYCSVFHTLRDDLQVEIRTRRG